jgi:hypothetical protein
MGTARVRQHNRMPLHARVLQLRVPHGADMLLDNPLHQFDVGTIDVNHPLLLLEQPSELGREDVALKVEARSSV